MEMHQIKYFIAISKHLNFARAARDCHVSPPSLSRAIYLLEEELGGALIVREGRTTHLTELGRRLLPLLQEGYSSCMNAQKVAKSIRTGERKPIVISVAPTIDNGPLAEVFTKLRSWHSQIEIQYQRCCAEDALNGLRNGSFDLAVVPNFQSDWDRLDRWHLDTVRISAVVSVSHRLASSNSVHPAELAAETLIARPDCQQVDAILSSLSADGYAPLRHQVFCDLDALSFAEINLGVALLPDSREITSKFRRLNIEGLPVASDIYLCAVSGRPRTPVLRKFIEIVSSGRSRNVPKLLSSQPNTISVQWSQTTDVCISGG